MPLLEISEEATALAKDLILIGPLRERAEVDALHIAIAVTNQVDYLLNVNCTHLANASLRHQMDVDKPVRGVRAHAGDRPYELCLP